MPSRYYDSRMASDNLRIIITRHGERADSALGMNWLRRHYRGGRSSSSPLSYLSPRDDFNEWDFDPPLTSFGEYQSASTGQKLLRLGFPIDYCYSSPAYRTIQTANKILEAQGRKSVPINIEPGLFECPSWYGDVPVSFIPPEYLAMDRNFNIDPYYSPVYPSVNMKENEGKYYQRSNKLIKSIVAAHKHEGGTILLSGHAGSIDALTRGLIGRRIQPQRLQYAAGQVNYCNFAILERDASTGRWFVYPPEGSGYAYGEEEHLRSTIPLHGVTLKHLRTNFLRGNLARPRHRPFDLRSRNHFPHYY